ncbi:hypothetical protein [Caldimonas brevitalea]|uniref:Uncharacterized protein n=1 Tax=Caldimonas brevitalea TaxID=413882 RepID=A0A0G3BTS8_9BURK|nr:hypothetical protein [Caldimonas brevitalea]AKJ31443.1 hypothetical protein AAW51_4752 [Caldimonas brevitalea]
MNPVLTKRCAVALLAAMTLALVVGLLAYGPILGPSLRPLPAPPAAAHSALHLLAALNLLAAGLWGCAYVPLPRDGGPPVQAWRCWFVSIALAGAAAFYAGLDRAHWPLFLLQAASGVAHAMLLCTFLAERLSPRWDSAWVLLAALSLSIGAVSHWTVGELTLGAGDQRALLLLQLLPLLLIPSGALRLEGRYTHRNDWTVVLTLYALGLLAQASHARLAPWLGPLAGPTLQLLLLASAAAWLAQRAATSAPRSAPGATVEAAPTEASTSLKTCG